MDRPWINTNNIDKPRMILNSIMLNRFGLYICQCGKPGRLKNSYGVVDDSTCMCSPCFHKLMGEDWFKPESVEKEIVKMMDMVRDLE